MIAREWEAVRRSSKRAKRRLKRASFERRPRHTVSFTGAPIARCARPAPALISSAARVEQLLKEASLLQVEETLRLASRITVEAVTRWYH